METANSSGDSSDVTILIAGDWRHTIYESACADALRRLGVIVVPFKWSSFFDSLLGRAERKYNISVLCIRQMNDALIRYAEAVRPDVVLIWRGVNILPETIEKLKRCTGGPVVSFNNDDPFSPQYVESRSLHLRRLWKLFVRTIPLYDCNYVYRSSNIPDYDNAGSRRSRVLRSYFVPSIHNPVKLTDAERGQYGCDVVFIGHCEQYRYDCLEYLAESEYKLRVYGPLSTWMHFVTPQSHFRPNPEITGETYSKALCAARLCLCFFSRLNRDAYTRRVFEITACGGVLLSERTPEMLTLFAEGSEALYFSSPEELKMVVASAFASPKKLKEIAEAGRLRCIRDGHSVDDRMKAWLADIGDIRRS